MSETIIGKQLITAGNSGKILLRFIMTLFFSCVVLLGLKDLPVISILLVDVMFCWFFTSIFVHRLRYLFLLHPIVMLGLSMFFKVPFLELGDGLAYRAVVYQYVDSNSLVFHFSSIFSSLGVLEAFHYMSLGVAPIFVIPEYLYGRPESNIYYLWQGTFHVILVAICVTLSKIWKVTRDEYLFFIVLFAIVSPSFFELGNAPTRHIFTFFSVFLFYISFVAIFKKFSILRLLALLTAVVCVIISKFPLLIPILVFCAYYAFSASSYKFTLKVAFFVLAVILATILCLGPFSSALVTYAGIAKEGAETFSVLTKIPLLGIFFKYLYALLAPFPWQKAIYHIEIIYGGNAAFFFMHMISSLMGIYFFARILMYGKPLFKDYPDIRFPIMFGLIMSLSILGGTTGFDMYLLIYFPFLAPLLAVKKNQISWWVPVGIVVIAEALYTISIWFV